MIRVIRTVAAAPFVALAILFGWLSDRAHDAVDVLSPPPRDKIKGAYH